MIIQHPFNTASCNCVEGRFVSDVSKEILVQRFSTSEPLRTQKSHDANRVEQGNPDSRSKQKEDVINYEEMIQKKKLELLELEVKIKEKELSIKDMEEKKMAIELRKLTKYHE